MSGSKHAPCQCRIMPAPGAAPRIEICPLHAAAPELLAACKALDAIAPALAIAGGQMLALTEARAKIRAAIARAEGRT